MTEPYLISPKGWTRVTLEADPTRGYISRVDTGATPSTKNDNYWDGDIPWLSPKEITNINGRLYVSTTARHISAEGLKRSAAKLLPQGTVMLTKRAPVGLVVINAEPMATNQGFLNFTCGPKLRPEFLAYWLKSSKPYLYAVANGSTYPELYSSDLFEFEIAVPPIAYQDKVIKVINSIQTVIALESSLEQLTADPDMLSMFQQKSVRIKTLRDKLLPVLISGQLDISNLV